MGLLEGGGLFERWGGGLNREFTVSRLSIIVIVNNGFEPVKNDICSF